MANDVSIARARSRSQASRVRTADRTWSSLEFFAGCGLAAEGLKPFFSVAWANDICEKKALIYRANHKHRRFHLGSIEDVLGADLPDATLSWASFPCQDLSLAGQLAGLASARSGLVWQWLRVMDEMPRRPMIVAAENVLGLVSASAGAHYQELHRALVDRGYRVGAVVLDAVHWVPQSRPRVFVVGVLASEALGDLEATGPLWCHPSAVQRAADAVQSFVWWSLPEPTAKLLRLHEILDFDAPTDDSEKTQHNLSLIPAKHRERMRAMMNVGPFALPGYKRTRNGRQVLELRFDDIAGCLRTPEGGSSRQVLVLYRNKELSTRLLTPKELARLMGAGDYRIVGTYNEVYKAMGDAVVVPVVQHLTEHLLAPLARMVGSI